MRHQEQIIIPFYFMDSHENLKFETIQELNDELSLSITDSGEGKTCIKSENMRLALNDSALHFISFNWADQEIWAGQDCLMMEGGAKLIFRSRNNDIPLHIRLEVVDDQISQNALDFGIAQPPFGNKLNVTNSLVSYLNQDVNNFIEPVNLPTIDQFCFQGKKLPLLGIIDIRNDVGLRQNLSLSEAKSIISINMGARAEASYDFEIYSGPEGNGTFLFSLSVDDTGQPGSSESLQTADRAFITLNNVSLSQFPLSLNCQRNLQIVNNLVEVNGASRLNSVEQNPGNGQTTTTFNSADKKEDSITVTAGESISLTFQSSEGKQNVTNLQQDVVIETVALGGEVANIAALPSRIVKKTADLTKLTYIFDKGVPHNGTYNIVLANRLAGDKVRYRMTVL